jgi:dinuclear metal center YbgI/SA1388 family protein
MPPKTFAISDLCAFLETFAPLRLAEEWDNVGLLVGDAESPVQRIMTCLTLTTKTVEEALREQADVVIAHHPLPFKPLKRLTTATTAGRLLLQLIRGKVSVYSPHTAFDSAADGINQHLAIMLRLTNIEPLIPGKNDPEGLGTGRVGHLIAPTTLGQFVQHAKQVLRVSQVQVVGAPQRTVLRVGVGCGSAGSMLEAARTAECDVFLTGETNLHTCYEAEASNIGLIAAGHFATERFHLDYLADILRRQFPALHVWSSRDEQEPMVIM